MNNWEGTLHIFYFLLYGSATHSVLIVTTFRGHTLSSYGLSPKLCFLGLTMCATSKCNPISQTVKGNSVFNHLALTSCCHMKHCFIPFMLFS